MPTHSRSAPTSPPSTAAATRRNAIWARWVSSGRCRKSSGPVFIVCCSGTNAHRTLGLRACRMHNLLDLSAGWIPHYAQTPASGHAVDGLGSSDSLRLESSRRATVKPFSPLIGLRLGTEGRQRPFSCMQNRTRSEPNTLKALRNADLRLVETSDSRAALESMNAARPTVVVVTVNLQKPPFGSGRRHFFSEHPTRRETSWRMCSSHSRCSELSPG